MTTITIDIRDWARELRAIPRRDHEALLKAARMTAFVDAQRWIQWSIRGGGLGGDTGAVRPNTPTSKPRRKTGKRPSAWSATTKTLRKFLGGTSKGKKPRVRKGPKPGRAKAKKARGQPPAYRIPIDTGDYANSWTPVKLKNGAMFYSASNPRIKAGVIEFGRRPGKGIPITPLAAWVSRKLGVKDEKAKGVAIAISKKAKAEGRKGLRVMGRAHPKIIEAFKKNSIKLMKTAHSRAGKTY